jgi:hypothetical protein
MYTHTYTHIYIYIYIYTYIQNTYPSKAMHPEWMCEQANDHLCSESLCMAHCDPQQLHYEADPVMGRCAHSGGDGSACRAIHRCQ